MFRLPRPTPRVLASSLALLVALALLVGGVAHAKGRHHGKRSPHEFMTRHAERLGLDEATLAEIEDIVTASEERDDEIDAQMDQGREEIRAMLEASEPDRAAIMEKVEAQGALETEEHKNRLRAIMDIRALLTPEQRAELAEIREERKEEWRRKHRYKEYGPLGACSEDRRDPCGDASGRALLGCMQDRYAELSEPCRGVLEEGPEDAAYDAR